MDRIRRELGRTNFSGRRVTLAEGVAVVVGSTALLAARGHRAQAVTIGGIGMLGLIDDLVEPHRSRRDGAAPAKGLRGHLRALRRGELTTGGLKALGIPVLAVAGTADHGGIGPMTLVDGALVAGSANLVNLLDLRPGRALKAVLPLAALLAVPAGGPRSPGGPRLEEQVRMGTDLARTALLTGGLALPADLREHGMLGDSGANTLGALLGAAAVRALPASARAGALLGVLALTVASERVSFSAVIASRPLLRRIDELGRRPAPGSAVDEEDA